jgi:hypothetical protein
VIVHINHIAPSKKKAAGQRSAQSELAGLVTGSMMSMVEEGVLDPKIAPSLRVHLRRQLGQAAAARRDRHRSAAGVRRPAA